MDKFVNNLKQKGEKIARGPVGTVTRDISSGVATMAAPGFAARKDVNKANPFGILNQTDMARNKAVGDKIKSGAQTAVNKFDKAVATPVRSALDKTGSAIGNSLIKGAGAVKNKVMGKKQGMAAKMGAKIASPAGGSALGKFAKHYKDIRDFE